MFQRVLWAQRMIEFFQKKKLLENKKKKKINVRQLQLAVMNQKLVPWPRKHSSHSLVHTHTGYDNEGIVNTAKKEKETHGRRMRVEGAPEVAGFSYKVRTKNYNAIKRGNLSKVATQNSVVSVLSKRAESIRRWVWRTNFFFFAEDYDNQTNIRMNESAYFGWQRKTQKIHVTIVEVCCSNSWKKLRKRGRGKRGNTNALRVRRKVPKMNAQLRKRNIENIQNSTKLVQIIFTSKWAGKLLR